MTSPVDPLNVPENRELLIGILDSAAWRYRKQARVATDIVERAIWLADAATAELLSEHFLNECDRG